MSSIPCTLGTAAEGTRQSCKEEAGAGQNSGRRFEARELTGPITQRDSAEWLLRAMRVADRSVWPTRYRRRRASYKVVLGERSFGRPHRVPLPLFNTWGFIARDRREGAMSKQYAVDREVVAGERVLGWDRARNDALPQVAR